MISGMILFLSIFFYGGINSLSLFYQSLLEETLTPELGDVLRKDSGVSQGFLAPIYPYVLPALGKLASLGLLGFAIFKKNKLIFCAGLCLVILELIGLAGNLSKSSFVFFLIQIIIFFILIYDVKINFLRIGIFTGAIILLLVQIYLLTTNAENSSMARELLFNRVFGEPNRVLALHMQYWPDIFPHTNGLNIRLVHSMFGSGDYLSAAQRLCFGSYRCTFNVIFFGEAYIDFSWFGVVFYSLIVGLLLTFLDFFIFKKKTWLRIALFSTLISALFGLTSNGLITILVGFGLLTLPVFIKILKIKF
jgi:hypothetical protein